MVGMSRRSTCTRRLRTRSSERQNDKGPAIRQPCKSYLTCLTYLTLSEACCVSRFSSLRYPLIVLNDGAGSRLC
jgi:hypothetical protein